MSGCKSSTIIDSILSKRSLTIDGLAKRIYSGRSHLSQVLNNRREGRFTRRRVIDAMRLSEDEIVQLGWDKPRKATSANNRVVNHKTRKDVIHESI